MESITLNILTALCINKWICINMSYFIALATLAYVGAIGSVSHAFAQNNVNDVPVSIWDIFHTLSDHFPPSEKLPFLARRSNCIRCERHGVRTTDNTIVDIAVIYQHDQISTVIIDNFRYDKRKCVTMLDVKNKNNFLQKDYSFFPVPDSYAVQVGYKTFKGNIETIFTAERSIKDRLPLNTICLSLFSVSKDAIGM